MHCHGGITLEQLKLFHFHMDVHPRQRMFFFTTHRLDDVELPRERRCCRTSCRCCTTAIPAWPTPDLLWKMADDTGANLFGASPTYQGILEKAGIVPKDRFELDKLETDRARRLAGHGRMPGMVLREREAATSGRTRAAAAPTSAPDSSAASSTCRSTRARSRRGSSAWPPMRSTSRARRRRPGRRAGADRADAVDAGGLLGRHGRRAATASRTSTSAPAYGGTAISSASMRAAAASCSAARTRR